MSTAIFVSANELRCPFTPPASLLQYGQISVMISNDGGLTESENALTLLVPSALPRLVKLTSPRLLFAGQPDLLVFSGSDLAAFGARLMLEIADPILYDSTSVKSRLGCTPNTAGTEMACDAAMLPVCPTGTGAGCKVRLTLWAINGDPATEVR